MAESQRLHNTPQTPQQKGGNSVLPLYSIRVLTGCCLFVFYVSCGSEKKGNQSFFENIFSIEDPSAYSDKSLIQKVQLADGAQTGPYTADTTFVDDNKDSVTVQLEPYALVQLKGSKKIKNPDNANQPYQLDYQIYCVYDNKPVEHIEVKSRCEFVKTVKLINNYAIDLTLSKGGEEVFKRTLTKDVFAQIVEDFALRRSVIVGVVPGPYNSKHQQLVLRIRLAENYGSNWWIETYVSLDMDGKIKLKGLVDYSPDCDGGVRFSPDQQQLITCSEIADYQGTKIKLNRGQTTLVRQVSPNIFAVVYNLKRKTHMVCDTTINLGDEMLTLQDYDFSDDTVSNNVFLLSSLGDTLAKFYYHKSISDAEYTQHFAYNTKYQSVGFFNSTLNTVLYIPVGKSKATQPKPVTYRLAQLQQLKVVPQNAEYLEFTDVAKAKQSFRFYIVDEKIYAYTQTAAK